MNDENQGRELPHRVRGAAGAAPRPSAGAPAPVLSDELRQRMQAAVKAERAEAAAHEQERAAEEQTTVLPRPASLSKPPVGHETRSPAGGANGKRGRAAKARASAVSGKTAKPRTAAKAQTAAKASVSADLERAVKPQPPAKPEPPARPKPQPPARPVSRAGNQPAELPSATIRRTQQKPRKRRRRRGVRLVMLVLAVIVAGSLSAFAMKHFTRPSPTGSPARPQPGAAVRTQAAAWVARQVSPGTTVACDQAMCAALKAHGSAAKLVTLGSASPDPVPAVLVVETPAVHDLFGSSLATAWAPVVLASFGSGTDEVTVRVVAPHGAAAYQGALNADLTDRKTVAASLLNDSQITLSATAQTQLTAGRADPRLMLALASLAGRQPIMILQFGEPGPGAGAVVPLRFADLAESVPAAHLGPAAYVRAVKADLSAVKASIQPATVTTPVVQGQAVIRVEFTAPSPLGMLHASG